MKRGLKIALSTIGVFALISGVFLFVRSKNKAKAEENKREENKRRQEKINQNIRIQRDINARDNVIWVDEKGGNIEWWLAYYQYDNASYTIAENRPPKGTFEIGKKVMIIHIQDNRAVYRILGEWIDSDGNVGAVFVNKRKENRPENLFRYGKHTVKLRKL